MKKPVLSPNSIRGQASPKMCSLFPLEPSQLKLDATEAAQFQMPKNLPLSKLGAGVVAKLKSAEETYLTEQEKSALQLLLPTETFSLNSLGEVALALADAIPTLMLENCLLDGPLQSQLVKQLWKNCVAHLLTKNPAVFASVSSKLCEELKSKIEGEEFYSFHPLHLVESYLWAKEVHRIALHAMKKVPIVPVDLLALKEDLESIQLEQVPDDVCDQDAACDYIEDVEPVPRNNLLASIAIFDSILRLTTGTLRDGAL